MKYTSADLRFLKGLEFSEGYRLRIEEAATEPLLTALPDRFSFLSGLVSGKRVLHVGCCDHLPLIDKKRADGVWLHDRLLQAASYCAGIDTCRDAIHHLQELGVADVYEADVCKDLPGPLDGKGFDFVVFGELLEHISDPSSFLCKARKTLAPIAAEAVFTVPNALSSDVHYESSRGYETINSDHRFWFTPYTCAKVLVAAGLEPRSFHFVQAFASPSPFTPGGLLEPRAIRRMVHHFRLRTHASLRDTLIVRARL